MWTVTFSVVDGKNKGGSFSLNFDGSRTLAQIEGFLTGVAASVNGVMLGAFTAISITRSFPLTIAWRSVPAVNSDTEEKLMVIFDSVAGYIGRFAIPTLNEAVVVEGSSAIDQTNPFVITLNTALETGIDVSGVLVRPSDNRGSPVGVIRSENEAFVNSSRP